MKKRKKDSYYSVWEHFAYMSHSVLTKWMQNEKVYLVITFLFSFFYVFGIILYAWPVETALELGYFLVFLIMGLAAIILLTKFIIASVFVLFLCMLKPAAVRYYQSCKNNVRSGAGGKNIVTGQEAKVGLKYFINLEKERSLYYAEYLGPV